MEINSKSLLSKLVSFFDIQRKIIHKKRKQSNRGNKETKGRYRTLRETRMELKIIPGNHSSRTELEISSEVFSGKSSFQYGIQ